MNRITRAVTHTKKGLGFTFESLYMEVLLFAMLGQRFHLSTLLLKTLFHRREICDVNEGSRASKHPNLISKSHN